MSTAWVIEMNTGEGLSFLLRMPSTIILTVGPVSNQYKYLKLRKHLNRIGVSVLFVRAVTCTIQHHITPM